MKIFKGAYTGDELTLTDQKDLSEDVKSWVYKRSFTMNSTKTMFAERKSVVNVEVSEEDILALYKGPQEGRDAELAELRAKGKIYEKALREISQKAMFQRLKPTDDFSQIIEEIADEALKKFGW